MKLLKNKPNRDLEVQFDQQSYDLLASMVNQNLGLLDEAKQEFKKLNVEVESLEQLEQSDFLELVENSYKAKFDKSAMKKDGVSFEKFKEINEVDTSKVEDLQARYNQKKNQVEEFYAYNDSFFKRCESAYTSKDPFKEKIFKLAPEKKKYKLSDFYTIKGNKIKLDIPREPFRMFLFNKHQRELMISLNKFVEASKELEFEPKFIRTAIGKYLSKNCDYQLSEISFKYDAILTHKL